MPQQGAELPTHQQQPVAGVRDAHGAHHTAEPVDPRVARNREVRAYPTQKHKKHSISIGTGTDSCGEDRSCLLLVPFHQHTMTFINIINIDSNHNLTIVAEPGDEPCQDTEHRGTRKHDTEVRAVTSITQRDRFQLSDDHAEGQSETPAGQPDPEPPVCLCCHQEAPF